MLAAAEWMAAVPERVGVRDPRTASLRRTLGSDRWGPPDRDRLHRHRHGRDEIGIGSTLCAHRSRVREGSTEYKFGIRCRSGTCRASSTWRGRTGGAYRHYHGVRPSESWKVRGSWRAWHSRLPRPVLPAGGLPVAIADEQDEIESAIQQLAVDGCCQATTGGTGPAERDNLEATEAAGAGMLPGFGEAMRTESLRGTHRDPFSQTAASVKVPW